MAFVSGGMGRRGACQMKHAFPSREVAQKVLDKMIERGAYGPSLVIRRCRYGKRDHFHICHDMTKDRKPRRK